MKNLSYCLYYVLLFTIRNNVIAQGGPSSCATVNSSTLAFVNSSNGNCTFSFTPNITINDKPKLLQFTFTSGSVTQYVCYQDLSGAGNITGNVQSTPCGSSSDFFVKNSTTNFPTVQFTLPCAGTKTMSFDGFNGANGTAGTGSCVSNSTFPTTDPGNPLPVKLISFTSKQKASIGLELEWQTAEEINSQKFIIQRSSDALVFSYLSEISARNNSSETSNYSYLDNFPLSGNNYYRLKMVDNDGSFTNSKIIVSNWEYSKITLYPNPVTENSLRIKGVKGEILSSSILNLIGSSFPHDIVSNQDELLINLSPSISSGIYFININTTETQLNEKFIIIK